MQGDYRSIIYESTGGAGTITLNRPERLNGLTNQTAREVHHVLQDVALDYDTRVVVLTGAGRGFCPGADLKHHTSGEEDAPLHPEHLQVTALLHELPQVTLAAINGACAGAGLGGRLRPALCGAECRGLASNCPIHPKANQLGERGRERSRVVAVTRFRSGTRGLVGP